MPDRPNRATRHETIHRHGGKRPGAGRPRAKGPRCPCGVMTLKRAIARWHKCHTYTPSPR